MKRLAGRRSELLALLVGVAFAAAHLATSRPKEGLAVGQGREGAVDRLTRAVQTLEGRATDAQFRLRGEKPAHPGVLVVEIDEKSAQRFGRWPWSRAIFGQALNQLVDAGAASIGLDVALIDTVPDTEGPLRSLVNSLEAVPSLPQQAQAVLNRAKAEMALPADEVLAQALRAGGQRIVQGVIPYTEAEAADFSSSLRASHLGCIEPALIRAVPGRVEGSVFEIPSTLPLWATFGVQTPQPQFCDAGTSLGHFTMVPDVDGTIRRMAIIGKVTSAEGALLPSMALQAAAVAFDARIIPTIEAGEVTEVRLGEGTALRQLPLEGQAPYLLINYPGSSRVFQRLSIADVIEGQFDRSRVKDKVVLIGVTIVGSSGDQRVTPFREFEPGVFTHAAVVSNIIADDFLRRPFGLLLLELAAMVLGAVGLGLSIPRVSRFVGRAGLIVGTLAAWLLVDQFALHAGWQVATVLPVACLLVSAFVVVFEGYLSVDREKLALKRTFSRYLGEDVMEAALANPEALNVGEKREMTVLFSDIRGFTSLSERMEPEALASFINEYLSPMTKLVFDGKGTLDKYIGDAVMAFWNAPLPQADHALRACRCAVQMLAKLDELKIGWLARGYPALEVGIGINTGPMVVGNMGSDVRVDYTVLGDAVNLGARLEGTNKEYDTRIIIAESTYAALQGQLVCRRLGVVRVKGKRLPVGIYELRGEGPASAHDAKAVAAFETGLGFFLGRDLAQAQVQFEAVLSLWPGDAPSRRYLHEIDALRAGPIPPEWDGVLSLTTK